MAGETRHTGAEYLLGALDPAERAAFEEALKRGDALAFHELAEAREMLGLLGHAADLVTPEASVKERLFAKIPSESDDKKFRALYLTLVARTRLLAAAVVILSLLSVGMLAYMLSLKQQLIERSTELTSLEFELAIAKNDLAKKEHYLRIVKSPQTRVITMNSTSKFPGGTGKVLWNRKANEAVFMASGLRNSAKDKEWELWIIQDGKPVSAGTFNTDDIGQTVVSLNNLPHPEKASTFAVTLEPKGGKPEPEGEIYIVGSL